MTDMSLTSTTGMEVTPYIVDSVASTAPAQTAAQHETAAADSAAQTLLAAAAPRRMGRTPSRAGRG